MLGPCLLNQVTNRDFEKSLTSEERSAFWRYAKSLGADKGVDHNVVIGQMAQDFHLPDRLVRQALKGPKSVYRASEEVRARQKASARFLSANARHLEQLDKTGAVKLMNFLYDGSRRGLLWAHGPVPPVIHAIDILPTNPVKFVRQYLRGFAALSENAHKRIMDDLETRDYYKVALDAGLPMERAAVEGFRMTGWAGRAMDAALKPLRYELWESKWKSLPESERTPEMAKAMAIQYAHATMSLVKGEKLDIITRGFRRVFLAPLMTPTRIAKSIFDPIETVGTFERLIESKVNPKVRPPTDVERRLAYNRVRRAATFMGVTLGALSVNEKLLRATGSNQKVNYDKPIRSDFLAFKFHGKSWRMRGTIEIVALVSKLSALASQKHKYGQQTPEEAVTRYGEYKLTPGIGIGKELLSGTDVFGRPVPWSKDPGSAKFPRKNWMEFVGEHGPIFFGHAVSAFHETLRDRGVDTRVSMNVIRAITKNPKAVGDALTEATEAGVAEFFGINLQNDRYIGK